MTTDEKTGWDTGITLRRATAGYIWSIGVAADSNSQDDLDAAVDKAIATDARLTANYGPVTAKAKSTTAE
jgi:hypothetical protein